MSKYVVKNTPISTVKKVLYAKGGNGMPKYAWGGDAQITYDGTPIAQNAIGGAQAGAAIGSVIPGVGTLAGAGIGAVGGALVGGVESLINYKDQQNAQKAYDNRYKYAMGGNTGTKPFKFTQFTSDGTPIYEEDPISILTTSIKGMNPTKVGQISPYKNNITSEDTDNLPAKYRDHPITIDEYNNSEDGKKGNPAVSTKIIPGLGTALYDKDGKMLTYDRTSNEDITRNIITPKEDIKVPYEYIPGRGGMYTIPNGYNASDIHMKDGEGYITPKYAMGGNEQPNAEVEGGEYIQNPDESMKLAVGPSHAEGGIKTNLVKGSFVFPASYKAKVDNTNGDRFKLGTMKQKVLQEKKEYLAQEQARGMDMMNDPHSGANFGTEMDNEEPEEMPNGVKQTYAYGGTALPNVDDLNNPDNVQDDYSYPVTSPIQSQELNMNNYASKRFLLNKPNQVSDPMQMRNIYSATNDGTQINTINPIPVTNKYPISNIVDDAVNKSELSVNTNGGLVTKALQLAPTLYNGINALSRPETVNPNYTSYNPANEVKNLKYEIQPQLNDINSGIRTANRNIDEGTSSSSVARANKANNFAIGLSQQNRAYGEKSNIENQYRVQGANMENQINQSNSSAKTYAEDAEARNRAATRNYGANAAYDVAKVATDWKQDENLSNHDYIALTNIVAQHPELANKSASFIKSTKQWIDYNRTGKLNKNGQ